MIRYKIYQNQQKKGLVRPGGKRRDIRPCQTCRTHVETQFTVFQWGDQRRAH